MTNLRCDQRLRNKIGGFLLEPDTRDGGDTLAIALCSYFERHVARPLDDTESENGWSAWAETRTNQALDALTLAMQPVESGCSHDWVCLIGGIRCVKCGEQIAARSANEPIPPTTED